MVERGYGGPKVAIFDGQNTLLYESPDTEACGDLSLKHIIVSLRRVQQKSNEFLTKLVHEQSSQNMCNSETVAEDEDCADEEDDGVGNEGEGERTFPKKAKWQ